MNILFLCVANSVRSQMAEGIARNVFGPGNVIQSAGSAPTQINPFAIKVMAEVEIDITSQNSKSVQDIDPSTVDKVITLCEEEVCPSFLGNAQKEHWPVADPASVEGTEEDKLNSFRTIRDQIAHKIKDMSRQVA
jgi:arsenate reductase